MLGSVDYVSHFSPTPYTPQGARLEPHKAPQRAHKGLTRPHKGLTRGDTQGRGSEGSTRPLWALWPWLVSLGFHVGTHTGLVWGLGCLVEIFPGPGLCVGLCGLVWACVWACGPNVKQPPHRYGVRAVCVIRVGSEDHEDTDHQVSKKCTR